mmetsp:Transcript_15472/g.31552  ORF Transcript_15472/g.31552 Transcript_15472/m.31552 type:complete len:101 (+) Transcript_15472:338-640(+)
MTSHHHRHHAKCSKHFKVLSKVFRDVDLKACGSRENNALVQFLRCEVKHSYASCRPLLASYERCHKSVMGVGTFGKQTECASELKGLQFCVCGQDNDLVN